MDASVSGGGVAATAISSKDQVAFLGHAYEHRDCLPEYLHQRISVMYPRDIKPVSPERAMQDCTVVGLYRDCQQAIRWDFDPVQMWLISMNHFYCSYQIKGYILPREKEAFSSDARVQAELKEEHEKESLGKVTFLQKRAFRTLVLANRRRVARDPKGATTLPIDLIESLYEYLPRFFFPLETQLDYFDYLCRKSLSFRIKNSKQDQKSVQTVVRLTKAFFKKKFLGGPYQEHAPVLLDFLPSSIRIELPLRVRFSACYAQSPNFSMVLSDPEFQDPALGIHIPRLPETFQKYAKAYHSRFIQEHIQAHRAICVKSAKIILIVLQGGLIVSLIAASLIYVAFPAIMMLSILIQSVFISLFTLKMSCFYSVPSLIKKCFLSLPIYNYTMLLTINTVFYLIAIPFMVILSIQMLITTAFLIKTFYHWYRSG